MKKSSKGNSKGSPRGTNPKKSSGTPGKKTSPSPSRPPRKPVGAKGGETRPEPSRSLTAALDDASEAPRVKNRETGGTGSGERGIGGENPVYNSGNGVHPQVTSNRIDLGGIDFVENLFATRRKFWEQLLDDRRNIDHECGYPPTEELTIHSYRKLYDREGIANRIVNLYPDESWVINPEIYEDEDTDVQTAFEEDFDNLAKSLRGDSWLEEDLGHPLWEYCHRVDGLSGIGHFGVLLIGIDDGKTLDQPAELKAGPKRHDVTYLRCFDESLVSIVQRDTDPGSKRFGSPVMYELTFEQLDVGKASSVTLGEGSVNTETKRVHWTRVIHVADCVESSELFAVPRLRTHINRMIDMRKLYGASAEGYWKGGIPPIFFKSLPELGTDVSLGTDSKDVLEAMMNSLQRYGFVAGIEPEQLDPTVSDPSKQIEVQLDNICIKEQCPKRIFVGSERGELASSQDSRTWNNRLRARQYRYLIPRLIAPTIDRLILLGCLTEPEKYHIEFKDLNALTDQEQAEIGAKRMEACAKFVQGDVIQILTETDFWTTIIGLDDELAKGIVERAEEALAERQEEEEAEREEMMKQMADNPLLTPPGNPNQPIPGKPPLPPGTPPGRSPLNPIATPRT